MRWRTGGWRGENPRQPRHPGCWLLPTRRQCRRKNGAACWRRRASIRRAGFRVVQTLHEPLTQPRNTGQAFRIGRRKVPKGTRQPSAREEEATHGLAQGSVVARTFRCFSIHTRPVSWLGPASSGAHPRTKGTRCFTGGLRHRIPSTLKGLLLARVSVRASHQETLQRERKQHRSGECADRDSRTSYLQASRAEPTRRGTHTVSEGLVRWMSRMAAGRAVTSLSSGRRGDRMHGASGRLALAAALAGTSTFALGGLDWKRAFTVGITAA